MLVEDLLERHLAVQLGVQGDEDSAQAAPGMGSQNAEPLAVAGGRADRVAGRAVGVAQFGRPGVYEGEGGLYVSIVDAGQALAGGGASGHGGEAFPGVTMLLHVQCGERGECIPLGPVEVASCDEMLGQRPRLIKRPRLESRDKLDLVDQSVLNSKQAEKEMMVGVGLGHEMEDSDNSCRHDTGRWPRLPTPGPCFEAAPQGQSAALSQKAG